MPGLEMYLGLRIRSKVNWVQNNKKIEKNTHFYVISHLYNIHLSTDTIQDVLKILVACIT